LFSTAHDFEFGDCLQLRSGWGKTSVLRLVEVERVRGGGAGTACGVSAALDVGAMWESLLALHKCVIFPAVQGRRVCGRRGGAADRAGLHRLVGWSVILWV
jgi:hypothetical protein